ncbi:hypothetical protein [Tunturiibacter lichenicola]|uniref:hypothetical protein n=1 Tax=Tunturiibacter lichenicola TaxID=2051959 RepID=UPI0021B23785|nr:hypothetical protein [Edaphobacter lichenicola]
MKTLLLCLALFGWQLQSNTPQKVVRLLHTPSIPVTARGEMIELLSPHDVVGLPVQVPGPDNNGVEWFVDVRNLGPNDVTIQSVNVSTMENGPQFSVLLHPKDVTRIRAAGSKYISTRRN